MTLPAADTAAHRILVPPISRPTAHARFIARGSFPGSPGEFHQCEILAISGGAFDWRFERADDCESDLFRELDDAGDSFAPQLFVLHHAALADLAFADLELRLDERDNFRARRNQRKHRRDHQTERDK